MIDTKTTLLLEAETLIRTRGYSGFSYADLAEIVGIRKASIHHHFPTKESLVAATLEGYRDRYARNLARIEADHADAIDRIGAYARLYLLGLNRGLGCLCAALAAELGPLPDSLRAETVSFFEDQISWIGRVYATGLDRGEVNPNLLAGEASRMIVSTLEGSLMMERMLLGREGFEATLRSLLMSLARTS
jgi:TetR/AcrR family transcriptional repressor of nem operon